MVMLEPEDRFHGDYEHSKKIADYLNRHPMFKNAGNNCICEETFYFYLYERYLDKIDDLERYYKMQNAIWITGDYTEITTDDCDWFFDQVEELWCECHNVASSGFFDPTELLPEVPKGLLKIPDNI